MQGRPHKPKRRKPSMTEKLRIKGRGEAKTRGIEFQRKKREKGG